LNNYGTSDKIELRYEEIKNKIITVLMNHIRVNKDTLDIIFNYIIITHRYELLTKNDCLVALKLGLVNKNFSSLFQIYNLKQIDICFYKLFTDTYYKELIRNTKKLEMINDEYIDIKNLIINTHKTKIMSIITSYEKYQCIKAIDHSDYIYLCNFYGYEYKKCDHPYMRTTYGICIICYFSICALFSPLCCVCCPCLTWWQIQACNHDPDPEEKHGPIALFELPLDLCNSMNRDKTIYQIINRYYCC
jgi:hypothetical protein